MSTHARACRRYDIVGRGGQALSAKWAAADPRHANAEWNGPGPKTFESYHAAGFPNLCMQNGPQGVFTINFVHQLDEASKQFAHIISEMQKRGKTKFDVKTGYEAKYLDSMWKMSPAATDRRPGCTPGYYNNEGVTGEPGSRVLGGMWRGLAESFFDHCEKKRVDGKALDPFDLA